MTKANPTEDRLLVGNCLDTIKTLADDSIDSIVTDPPYEIGFMGKGWDSTGIAYSVELWKECLRVLKPGGHLLSFGATRSYHRMAVAIEDAGFEIRDSIHWTYGSGFPKSLNVSKAIDKAAGVKGEVVGSKRVSPKGIKTAETRSDVAAGSFGGEAKDIEITAPATEAAKKWDGWGTALKPSHEPIVVARKPINQTVAENVLQYGTGAINIDATRVGTETITINGQGNDNMFHGNFSGEIDNPTRTGRFPANTLLTHNHDCDTTCTPSCPIELLDQQQEEVSRFFHNSQWSVADDLTPFIYQAKPGKKERNSGLDSLPEQANKFGNQRNGEDLGNGSVNDKFTTEPSKNFHPTVKPVELIRYLIKMVTPPKGTVLDPFLGSGTTAVAAILEGVEWKGCELTKDYLPIIEGRTAWATKERKKKAKQPKQETLL
jgi:site-specific DNA-methyltransferase (adenine-specific)